MHPLIAGELACGSLLDRQVSLRLIDSLPAGAIATDSEVRYLIETRGLHGSGIGFVDVHLLCSCQLSGCKIWTKDKALRTVAIRMGLTVG